ncbi:NAD(P)H-dependent oxidoreductase [Campylobacter sp. RM9328]|uniref:FMN-dependent NADH-azoreductase n=1 Tax=Campylobacter sp. RM9328 TaxID=1705720 RepID=UPI0032D5ABF7
MNAHPFLNEENSYSKKLQNAFLAEFRAKFDEDKLEILNLADEFIPALDGDMLNAWAKISNEEKLSQNEQKVADAQAGLLAQFKRCKRVVIVTPLHNFNITSKLKNYIDNIFMAGETFQYVTGGSVGLMNDGRKVMLLQASGGIYSQNDPKYSPMELTRIYIKGIFVDFMGFESFDIVRAEGTSVGAVDKDKMMADAINELKAKFIKFYE